MSGDTEVAKDSAEPLSIAEVVREAKARLSHALWDLASGGAESETTLKRNRLAMETYTFRSRVLRGVEPDLTTELFGRTFQSPVMLAPIGSIAAFHADGALVAARVAQKRRALSFVGTLAAPGVAEVAAGNEDCLAFQLYVRGDRDWVTGMVRKAEDAGYIALCLTVDSLGVSRREREVHNRFKPRAEAFRPNLPRNGGLGAEFQRRITWADFDWLRSLTDMPIIVKGIMAPEDALIAVERGASGIYVSNHGGRELDHQPSTLEVLPEIVDAVGGAAEVIVDSGFIRGSDVVKALSLGASAVGIGKLQVWAVAAGGDAALERTMDLLDEEIRHVLRLIGVGALSELSASCLRPATVVSGAEVLAWNTYEFPSLPRL